MSKDTPVNTLIYKRTHRGDPNNKGVFGCHECMGRIRRYAFDAAIGVGGKNPWHEDEDIAYRVNWIGIHRRKPDLPGRKGPRVRFRTFMIFDEQGCDIRKVAPKLSKYMFKKDHQVRFVMSESLPERMREEVARILTLVHSRQPAKRRLRKESPKKTEVLKFESCDAQNWN